ncbi:COG3617 Prophage antirepressor [uncultured Caudovirales phage]|uniref:COG3617 Prophage antirepressor n=1 Tax=uncultured Caudovirales phage TaxID=2100421 RepID=A0A6J5S4W9_9CAUD|nr:anti-repressor Ant [uncultured Caudovirales phage]CAB4202465.1 COG3617 Prophage antirepressor [uncultured Caudovirales phage]
MNTQLKPLANPFNFEALEVRTATDANNEVWFCAKDVCSVLDISWNGLDTLENMPENWKLVWKLPTSFGEKDTYFINEAGLYFLIFRSNKPKAKEFATWVCEEVLPTIRRQGFFGTLNPRDYRAIATDITKLTTALIHSKNVFEIKTLVPQLKTLHNLIGSKMPPLEMITADIQQHDLFLEG